MLRALIGGLLIVAMNTGAAMASETIGFDTYLNGSSIPGGTAISDQWMSLGVKFTVSDSISSAYTTSSSCSYSAPNHVGGNPYIIAWFVNPVTGAPAVTNYAGSRQDRCWVPGEGIAMEAYNSNGELIGQTFNGTAGGLATFSFVEPVIAAVRMQCIGQGIDDFVFNSPQWDGPHTSLYLSAVNNCIDLHAVSDNNLEKILSTTLVEGASYRVGVSGQAYKDAGTTPMVGVLLEYTDETGLRDRLLPAGEYFTFTSGSSEANDFKAYLVDSSPEDNVGQFTVLIVQMTTTGVASPNVPSVTTRLELYPNPFNPTTRIHIDMPEAGRARLSVHDVRGQLVRNLLDADLPSGAHVAVWDGKNERGQGVASGVYIASLETAAGTRKAKMTLAK